MPTTSSTALVPVEKRFKSELAVIKTEPAKKNNFCRLCDKPYQPGHTISQVKWGADDSCWGNVHKACYELLPETLVLVHQGQPGQFPLAPATVGATWRMLPETARHQGHRYAVSVDGVDVYFAGIKERVIGVCEYLNSWGTRT